MEKTSAFRKVKVGKYRLIFPKGRKKVWLWKLDVDALRSQERSLIRT